jgi:HlyD family secretion protein
LLKPGMTANVQFLVSRKEDVLAIPNMAVRFKPPDQKDEAQELLRQDQSRAAPRVGARRTSRTGGGGGGGARERRVKIYVLRNSKPQPIEVQLGITDGSKTEVRDGELNENDAVIIGMTSSANNSTQPGIANPFQPPQQPRGFGFR